MPRPRARTVASATLAGRAMGRRVKSSRDLPASVRSPKKRHPRIDSWGGFETLGGAVTVTAEELAPMERPTDHVERRPIASMTPHAGNPRAHPPEQIEQIAPRCANRLNDSGAALGEIIAWHGRVLGAPLLGWAEAPVMIARGWSEAQKRVYRIA